MNSTWSYSLETLNSGLNWQHFVLCELEIWWMTLKNNRVPLLNYTKLRALFQIHWCIQTWATVGIRSLWVKIGDFLSMVTLKLDGWPRKTIGQLFYTTLSSVHHFKAMGEFKLKLQSRNAQNQWFFVPCDLEIWQWPGKTIGHLSYAASSFLHHSIAIGEFKLELQSGNAQFRSKSAIFCPMSPWNLTDDLEKQ